MKTGLSVDMKESKLVRNIFGFSFFLGGFTFALPPDTCRIWVDGIYDLAHYGHQRAFDKARKVGAKHCNVSMENVQIVVGVNGGDIKAYKREPVMTLEQRVAQIQSFKGVDEVVSDAPLVFDDGYIEKYRLDLIMHGDDYTQEKIEKYFPGPYKRGIFKTYPYEPGISTTYIINRAIRLGLEALLEKPQVDCEDRAAVERVLRFL